MEATVAGDDAGYSLVIRHAATRRVAILILLAVSPFLLAIDAVLAPEDKPSTYDEKRAGLEQFKHDLEGVIESQIEEIAALDPGRDVAELRQSHYEWKLKRDLACAEKGLAEPDRLTELQCRSEADEKYYQDFEFEITELEAKLASQ